MKLKAMFGVVAIIAFTSLLFYNFGNSISSYLTFDQAARTGAGNTVHIVGRWDETKPAVFSNRTKTFTFYLVDKDGQERKVVYSKPKPNNFEQATSMVIIGRLHNGVFYADSMLLKCPSKYNSTTGGELTTLQNQVK